MKFPALYRRYPQSPIILAEYDCIKHTLFDYRFPVAYEYVEEYAVTLRDIDDLRLSRMYEIMLNRADALAVVLINNAYLSVLYPTTVVTEPISKEKTETVVIDAYYDYSYLRNEPIVPVGFERTFCRTLSVLITPGRIYYNEESKQIFYKNSWTSIEPILMEYKKKDLYKELVSTSRGTGIVKLYSNKSLLLD